MWLIVILLSVVCALPVMNAADFAIMEAIRANVMLLNGVLTSMNGVWQSSNDISACANEGITCDVNGFVIDVTTAMFFESFASFDNQLFNASAIQWSNLARLSTLTINHMQMVGSFNINYGPSLRTLVIDGTSSTSVTGGYQMSGGLPSHMFAQSPMIKSITFSLLPGLGGTLPDLSGLHNLTYISLDTLPNIVGPLPNLSFNFEPPFVYIASTGLSGEIPQSYCSIFLIPASEIVIYNNALITSQAACFQLCIPTSPAACQIYGNGICQIGQPVTDDYSFSTFFGTFSGKTSQSCGGTPPPYALCEISRDNKLCIGCDNNENSGFTYDTCGVCLASNDTTRNACLDCYGIPYGTNIYDVCDVCGGDGLSCKDCLGVSGGAAKYDLCGVCNGRGTTCDCHGTIGGTSVVDMCGVCGGTNACFDCRGIEHGTARYDVCDVCEGNGRSCSDCTGTPNGAAVYDVCDVCNGLGRDCDCHGVYLGFTVFDACDVCGGDGRSCLDCAGVPNGAAVYDACDVCNGHALAPPCINTPADHALVASAQAHSATLWIIIIASLVLICTIGIIIMAYTARAAAVPALPASVQVRARQRGGGGAGGIPARYAIFLVALAFGGVNAVLPETTTFIALLDGHTNLRTVYPEWYNAGELSPICTPSMPGLTCVSDGQDILEVNLTRTLVGEFQPSESQLIAYLPLATSLRIVDSPSFFFYIPSMVGATLLERIEIDNVGLSGSFPMALSLCTALTYLRFARTKIGESLPASGVSELVNLGYLEVSHSMLTEINLGYQNMLGLQTLNFQGNAIGSTLPPLIGSATNLREVLLDDNKITSTMPTTYLQLANLRELGLSGNQLVNADVGLFSGLFAGHMSESLETLRLDRNNFNFQLPDLTHYSNLRYVGLSHNKFDKPAHHVDASGTGGFDIGVTGASLLAIYVNDNRFKKLHTYPVTPFYGVCDFTNNRLCTTTSIPTEYLTANCIFNFLSNACGTCGDLTCLDCLGVPFGGAQLDVCGVCAGTGGTCADCAGVPFGPHFYNECDQCTDGPDNCPRDCLGTYLGTAVYDVCDVCNGDNACADCAGVPGGSSAYDACDVCNGHGHTCLDCAGVHHGTSRFDECGVCNGDGLTCAPPLVADYVANQHAFALFVGLSILLAVLAFVVMLLLYLIFNI